MKLVIASTSLFAMTSAVAAFSSITRRQFRHGITNHAARNVASMFTATAYMAPTPAFAGIGGRSSSIVRNNHKKASSSSLSMAEAPFTTWTFDEPCDTMEFNRITTASMDATGEMSVVDDSDLVVIGIYGPAKKEDEENEDEKKDDVPEPELDGKAKDLDEELGGAITEIMMENYKAFKHGGSAGGTTPTLRLASSGSKVSANFL